MIWRLTAERCGPRFIIIIIIIIVLVWAEDQSDVSDRSLVTILTTDRRLNNIVKSGTSFIFRSVPLWGTVVHFH